MLKRILTAVVALAVLVPVLLFAPYWAVQGERRVRRSAPGMGADGADDAFLRRRDPRAEPL